MTRRSAHAAGTPYRRRPAACAVKTPLGRKFVNSVVPQSHTPLRGLTPIPQFWSAEHAHEWRRHPWKRTVNQGIQPSQVAHGSNALVTCGCGLGRARRPANRRMSELRRGRRCFVLCVRSMRLVRVPRVPTQTLESPCSSRRSPAAHHASRCSSPSAASAGRSARNGGSRYRRQINRHRHRHRHRHRRLRLRRLQQR